MVKRRFHFPEGHIGNIVLHYHDQIVANGQVRKNLSVQNAETPFYFIANNGLSHLFVDGKTHPRMVQAVTSDVESIVSITERFSLLIYFFKVVILFKKVLLIHELSRKFLSSLSSTST